MLLLDGSRQLGLALPRFASQAEMNIQEQERRSHLWCSGLQAGSSWKAPCPVTCQSFAASQLPSPAERSPRIPLVRQPGGSPCPAAAGHGSARALAQWPFGAATQWDFSLIGCLAEGWAGQGLQWEPGRSERQWQLGRPQQSCAF